MSMLKSVAEQKYYDERESYNAAGTPLDNAGSTLNVMTEPPQGSSKNERIGDRISITSVQVIFSCYFPTAGNPTLFNRWRLIIFVWKDDTTPTLGEILEDVTIPTISPFNHDNKVKRKILYDKLFTQTFSSATRATDGIALANSNEQIMRKIILPSKLWRKYSNIYFTAGAGGAVNHIYYLAVSETNATRS